VLTPQMPDRKCPGTRVIETGHHDVLQDLKGKFGLKPGLALHDQLHSTLSTKQNLKLLHTKAIDWLKRWLAYPDFTKGWIPFVSEAVAELAEQERVGAILTTSPPESYLARPIHTVTNTFDPDDSRRRPHELTRTFSITYAGQLGERKGDPGLLCTP
jgi:hypothetical protein